MDIFQSHFYRLNVGLLTVIGLWPYVKSKSWQRIHQIITILSPISIILPVGIRLLEVWGDLDIMIECLTPIGVQLAAFIKWMNIFFNQKNMNQLLDAIKANWLSLKNEQEVEILTQYTKKGRNLTIFYTGYMYMSISIYSSIPLLPRVLDIIIPLNESRPYIFMYEAQYYVDQEKYVELIYLHNCVANGLTLTIVIAADTIFVCYLMHLCGILAVIGHRLENLTPKPSQDNFGTGIKSTEDDDGCHDEIIMCIEQHYRITQIADVIESSYTISNLLILGIAITLLSLSAVQMLIEFGNIDQMVKLFQLNVAQFCHLLFNSWPCQKLINQNSDFRESLYASKWYSLSENNKHLLKFVMLRASKSTKITAGKVYVMSLENFCTVLQTSMSYFTVFASVR